MCVSIVRTPQLRTSILAIVLGLAVCGGCQTSSVDDGAHGGGGEGGAGGYGGNGGTTEPSAAGGSGSGGAGGQAPLRVDFGIETMPKNSSCVAPALAEPGNSQFPKTISDTGCFTKGDPKIAVEGLIPYDLQSPLWSDGARKQRWFALPPGKTITVKTDGHFDFPVGAVLIKTFALEEKLLETRFLFRHDNGQWAGYTYVWNEDGSDATLAAPSASFRFVDNIEWTFPSRDNCLGCHQEAAGRTLGPEIAQMNVDFVYASNRKANQLRTLDHLGVFDKPLGDVSKLPTLPKPISDEGTAQTRLRSYLHSNCAHCHRPGGVAEVVMDLRFDTPLQSTNICNVVPAKGTYGVPDARIVTPGKVELSTMALRMRSVAQNVRMPSLGSAVVDEPGTALLEDWIASLKSCP